MKEMLNSAHVEGYVFNHNLKAKVTGENSKNPGTPFINGTINIATDDEGLNVVPVSFTYVTEIFSKSRKPNATYAVLMQIINNPEDVFEVKGVEAPKVRIDGRIGVNDFVTQDGEMASPKRFEGSFVHFMNATDTINQPAAIFNGDMIITSCAEREVENGDDYCEVTGYMFDFRKTALPVTFSVRSKAGMDYFMGQDISKSEPWCGNVWGEITHTTIVNEQTSESDFGAPQVNITTRTFRAWDVTGGKQNGEWDDDSWMTKDELKEALTAREEHLADVRKRNEEYRASQNGQAGFPTTTNEKVNKTAPAEDDFPF